MTEELIATLSEGESLNATIGEVVQAVEADHSQLENLDYEHAGHTGFQPTITDLSDIRTGAAAGATAYQKPSDGIPSTDMTSAVQTSLGKADTAIQEHQSLAGYATETWVESKGYLTEHQSLAAYRTSAAQDVIDATKADASDVDAIEAKIPAQATAENKLADRSFVNSSINSVTAYYITKTASGDQFATYAELAAATVFYSGGEVRVPTRNDYCIVQVDENHEDATTRYIFQNNQWEFQYVVNETALTSDQIAALNSGITSGLVSAYSGHIANGDIHVTAAQKSAWSAKQDALTFDTTPTSGSSNPVTSGGVYTALSGKQATIGDLATIRSGAAAGATAVQPANNHDIPSGGTTGQLLAKSSNNNYAAAWVDDKGAIALNGDIADNTVAYTKNVPNTAIPLASINMLGGKTLAWNQLFLPSDAMSPTYSNGINATKNDDGSISLVGTTTGIQYGFFSIGSINQQAKWAINWIRDGRKYCCVSDYTDRMIGIAGYGLLGYGGFIWSNSAGGVWYNALCIGAQNGEDINIQNKHFCVYDLTAMFGAGNEPSTVAEFRAMFPAAYYAYDAGSLLNADVVNVKSYNSDNALIGTLPIPQAVRNACPNYGASAGTAYNRIMLTDNESHFDERTQTTKAAKWWYKRDVGNYVLGSLNWTYHQAGSVFNDLFDTYLPNDCKVGDSAFASNIVCSTGYTAIRSGIIAESGHDDNVMAIAQGTTRFIVCDKRYTDAVTFKAAMSGVYLNYQLATTKWYALDDLMSDDNVLDTEAGGTIVFENSHGANYRIPVPSNIVNGSKRAIHTLHTLIKNLME